MNADEHGSDDPTTLTSWPIAIGVHLRLSVASKYFREFLAENGTSLGAADEHR
jgi:hypothetical protein